MNETAKHETLDRDPSTAVIEKIEKLDFTAMSFVQLKRLHKVFQSVSAEIARETSRRAEEDSSGDTVRVPSPKT
ncbi:MAG: hypothetical protein O3A13_13945 [Proteobacteria bacterium]|nr:hypothetical protein [Pseudomonadota bacterium]